MTVSRLTMRMMRMMKVKMMRKTWMRRIKRTIRMMRIGRLLGQSADGCSGFGSN